MKTLEDLFLAQLADIYDAEHRLAKAFPIMARVAVNDELRAAFLNDLDETTAQVAKLRGLFAVLGKPPKAKRCDAIIGLLREGEAMVAENKGLPTLDAALICAAQKVKHYEIATYGCLREWAEALGNPGVVDLIGKILEEEKSADDKLTNLACAICNPEAQEPAEAREIRATSRRRVRTSTTK